MDVDVTTVFRCLEGGQLEEERLPLGSSTGKNTDKRTYVMRE